MQHISDMHSKFTLRPHHVWKYATAKKRRGKKKKEETTGVKHNDLPVTMGGHKKKRQR